jgi:hypothetical protein
MIKITLDLDDLMVDTHPLGPIPPLDSGLFARTQTGMNTNEPGCTLPELCGGG